MMHSLVHVHGAIYIASNQAMPEEQPSEARAHGGCEADHAFERYAEAISAAVDRHLDEMEAFRGELHCKRLSAGCSSSCAGHCIESRGCMRVGESS